MKDNFLSFRFISLPCWQLICLKENQATNFSVKRWHGWKVRMTLHKLHLSIFTRKGLFFVAALKSETICLTCKRNTKVILQKLSEFQKNEYFSTPTTCWNMLDSSRFADFNILTFYKMLVWSLSLILNGQILKNVLDFEWERRHVDRFNEEASSKNVSHRLVIKSTKHHIWFNGCQINYKDFLKSFLKMTR